MTVSKHLIIEGIFILFVILFGFFLFGFYHEQAHIAIYKNWGVESHAEYFSHFPDMVTVTNEPISKEDCPDACRLAHSINESVGYHLIPIYFLIALGIIFLKNWN